MREIYGNIVDVFERRVYPGSVSIENGVIVEIRKTSKKVSGFLLPGFVDAHIHIESSMMTPANFARAAVRYGTVATVSDPHEIANVLGMAGVEFMIRNGETTPLKFHFGAPSCVPATQFETSGAELGPAKVKELLERKDVYFLSEMMNFPGVIGGDASVLEKIRQARILGKPVDGHAPGLRGSDLDRYVEAGIQTDHECSTYDEALEKIRKGMLIQIREGSAARNFENLYRLIDEFPDKVMLCSDDLHPDDLMKGHLNLLLSRGVKKGLNIYNLIRAISVNPVNHYNLEVGMLRSGDPADFVIVDNLENFKVDATYINGELVYGDRKVQFTTGLQDKPNKFFVNEVKPSDLKVKPGYGKLKVIRAEDGELVTSTDLVDPLIRDDEIISDTERDILKIVVVNRYTPEKPAIGFITNFGLKRGAMVSTIAHDSHNIIALGTDDALLREVIRWIQDHNGGVAFHDGEHITGLPLPVAGIMSDQPVETTAEKYDVIQSLAKNAGSTLKAPFMTLSFMALLVIPELKIGDKGLFDVTTFSYTSLFE